METITLKINTRRSKGRNLVRLINELEKEGSVEIQKSKVYKDIETALKEVKEGKVKPISELFKSSISKQEISALLKAANL
jgi:hypothetical protein